MLSCYLCVAVLFAAILGGYAAPAPAALHYIGVGYNVIRGNPDGNFWIAGGDDPGFLTTRKILSLSSGDVPAEIIYEHHDTCRQSHEFAFFYDPKSYQNKLLERVRTSGTGNENLTAAAFVLSSGFKAIEQQTLGDYYVFQDDQSVCDSGYARYQLSLSQARHFGITDEFAASICSLPITYDKNTYLQFIETWGTHVTTEVEIGGKSIKRYMAPRRDFIQFVRVNASDDVSVGGPFMNHASSLVVDLNSYQYRKVYRTVVGTLQDTLNLGSESVPEPIGMAMVVISDFLDSRFWQNINDYQTRGLCPPSSEKALQFWKRYLEQALNEYANNTNAHTPKSVPLAIPVTWPKGTYSLAKPKTGCPHGDFTWFEGWRFQNTETQSPDNAWSNGINLDGVLNKGDLTLKFCTKGELKPTSFDMDWPQGDYCIFKYGTCPTGFEEGFVKWDDEDTQNRNDWQGVLPDGVYNEDTLQRYCCRSDGLPTAPIILPTDKPFYLFQYKRDVCQQVANMVVTEEWLRWDDEDFVTPSKSEIGAIHPGMEFWNQATGASGSEIYYCHYAPLPASASP
ncbi:hypothetical protein CHS0354_004247 [Potamilus streckersoni]|uniref:MACPF domain-containing protein n=1 Tax=Potamilus streckersoni TaxID=2493646 RepID=A0AAE0S4J2_9BIVA|nr:hypothetical protein CHS0354_004247 [Potamilus streckersoni]